MAGLNLNLPDSTSIEVKEFGEHLPFRFGDDVLWFGFMPIQHEAVDTFAVQVGRGLADNDMARAELLQLAHVVIRDASGRLERHTWVRLPLMMPAKILVQGAHTPA